MRTYWAALVELIVEHVAKCLLDSTVMVHARRETLALSGGRLLKALDTSLTDDDGQLPLFAPADIVLQWEVVVGGSKAVGPERNVRGSLIRKTSE